MFEDTLMQNGLVVKSIKPKLEHYQGRADYDIMGSAIGNGILSGLDPAVIMYCLLHTNSAISFDIAIQRAIISGEELDELVEGEKNV